MKGEEINKIVRKKQGCKYFIYAKCIDIKCVDCIYYSVSNINNNLKKGETE